MKKIASISDTCLLLFFFFFPLPFLFEASIKCFSRKFISWYSRISPEYSAASKKYATETLYFITLLSPHFIDSETTAIGRAALFLYLEGGQLLVAMAIGARKWSGRFAPCWHLAWKQNSPREKWGPVAKGDVQHFYSEHQ